MQLPHNKSLVWCKNKTSQTVCVCAFCNLCRGHCQNLYSVFEIQVMTGSSGKSENQRGSASRLHQDDASDTMVTQGDQEWRWTAMKCSPPCQVRPAWSSLLWEVDRCLFNSSLTHISSELCAHERSRQAGSLREVVAIITSSMCVSVSSGQSCLYWVHVSSVRSVRYRRRIIKQNIL